MPGSLMEVLSELDSEKEGSNVIMPMNDIILQSFPTFCIEQIETAAQDDNHNDAFTPTC